MHKIICFAHYATIQDKNMPIMVAALIKQRQGICHFLLLQKSVFLQDRNLLFLPYSYMSYVCAAKLQRKTELAKYKFK